MKIGNSALMKFKFTQFYTSLLKNFLNDKLFVKCTSNAKESCLSQLKMLCVKSGNSAKRKFKSSPAFLLPS